MLVLMAFPIPGAKIMIGDCVIILGPSNIRDRAFFVLGPAGQVTDIFESWFKCELLSKTHANSTIV